MTLSEKKKKLKEIPDESAFRDALSTLFSKMGYKGVEILHGPDEDGKDIIFHEVDTIMGKKTYYAAVVKIGKLTGGTGKESTNVVNIANLRLCLAFSLKSATETLCIKRQLVIERSNLDVSLSSGSISLTDLLRNEPFRKTLRTG